MDVHGAGAQRSDPKAGVPANEKDGFGPQGDARRSYNYVRCVRGGGVVRTTDTTVDTREPTAASATPHAPAEGGSQEAGSVAHPQQPPSAGVMPPEAGSACSGKASGAVCSFTTPQGSVTGICRTTPGGAFACVPY